MVPPRIVPAQVFGPLQKRFSIGFGHLALKKHQKPVDGLTGSPLERLVSKTCLRITVFSGSRPPKTPNKPPPGAVSRRDSTKESAEKAERES